MSNFSVPTHLDHKPILAIRNYDKIDGYYDPNTTDAQHLSFGIAQWADDELSLKVWRHTGNRWSRQSEELPPHRAIDLVSLLCAALLQRKTNNSTLTLKGEDFEIEVDMVPEGHRRMDTVNDFFEEHHDLIVQRLQVLSNAIDTLKKEGII